MTELTRNTPEGDCYSSEDLTVYDGGWYEIVLKGRLDEYLVEWFGDMRMAYDGCGLTMLSGYIADQSALHGVLNQIRDLNLILVSLRRLDSRTER
jgi:hypothetical protein